jgi:hypothetical protein
MPIGGEVEGQLMASILVMQSFLPVSQLANSFKCPITFRGGLSLSYRTSHIRILHISRIFLIPEPNVFY